MNRDQPSKLETSTQKEGPDPRIPIFENGPLYNPLDTKNPNKTYCPDCYAENQPLVGMAYKCDKCGYSINCS